MLMLLRQCCRQRTLLVRLLLETRDVAAAVQAAHGVVAVMLEGGLAGAQVMAAHMVSIARREYANDWSWRKGSGAAAGAAADGSQTASANGSQAAARAGAPRAGGEGREASEGQPGPASEAALRGGERAATAVLEPPPAPAASGGTPGADAQAALSGDPVEPKRVLYSYYTVQARLPICSYGLYN